MNPIKKNTRIILKLMAESNEKWLSLRWFLEKTKIPKQDIIDVLTLLDNSGKIEIKTIPAGNGEIIELMATLLPPGKIEYYEILNSTKIVPSIVISLDGKKAIRIEEIENEWHRVPNYHAKSTMIRVLFHPNDSISWVEFREFWLDTEHNSFNWDIDNEQMQTELILLAIGEFLDLNGVPEVTSDDSAAVQIPLSNDIFQIKKRPRASNFEIINYLIYKNLWAWKFGFDEVIISHNDSSRLGITLEDLIRVARKHENEYWTINDNGYFKYSSALIREFDEKDNEIMPINLNKSQSTISKNAIDLSFPVEITESLQRFRNDYPDPNKVAFIMMKFGKTKAHDEIISAIKGYLGKYDIIGLRADDKQYHDDLFPNVMTYIYGCGFGIAIFERIEAEEFNPNVSLEVGYMFALKKPVCLLKDLTLKTLHVDLVGKLYKTFDPQCPGDSIPSELNQWLLDKRII